MEVLSHFFGLQYRLYNFWHRTVVMGFSASLQGDTSHAALLARQDAELRLLDTMKRVLVARAKCDRDYAAALTQLAHTAAKMDTSDNVLDDSDIHKAWQLMVTGLDEWSTLMRQNADNLVLETVEKMAALITEKRASRKVYFEEHQRITNEVTRLQEAVSKAKNTYEQALDLYKTSKVKYEDQYLKGKPGRKLDELKERYQKACKKLHQVHNDYVLLLCEAADYERDFRTVLLPGLLEYQERVQEDMVDKWQGILREVCELTDTSSGRYAHLQAEVSTSVSAIQPKTEYSTFADNNKSMPPEPVNFEFCDALLGDGVGSLQAGQLAVDSLTVDSLRLRLTDIEHRLREVTTELREKQNLLNQHETEVVNIKKNSIQDTSISSRLPVLKRASDVIRRELNELRCRESWLQHQHHLIHDPLAALGCEEAPQPWEASNGGQLNGDAGFRSKSLLSLNFAGLKSNSLLSLNFLGLQQHTRTDSLSLKSRSSAIKELLRKPFNRSKNSASPVSTPPTPTRANTEERNQLGDTGSLNDTSHDLMHTDDLAQANGVPELIYDPDRCLEDEQWFHGVLPRDEVQRLLVNDGDYLVRETTRNEEQQIVLSVRWTSHKHFIVQTTPEGHYRFEGPAFPTIQELILHQGQGCKLPVKTNVGITLFFPLFGNRLECAQNGFGVRGRHRTSSSIFNLRLRECKLNVFPQSCRCPPPLLAKKTYFSSQERIQGRLYGKPRMKKYISLS
ncbi:unnamed protein product, partial [Meganyctiphanes norvegica]